MFRETDDGSTWDVIQIHAARIADCEARGWSVLISAKPLDRDIAETYEADVNRFTRRG